MPDVLRSSMNLPHKMEILKLGLILTCIVEKHARRARAEVEC